MNNCKEGDKKMDPESEVFCLKMQADYNRYIAEVSIDESDQERCQVAMQGAKTSYDKADTIGIEHLGATHPVYLGLALNRSVFHYEILHEKAL